MILKAIYIYMGAAKSALFGYKRISIMWFIDLIRLCIESDLYKRFYTIDFDDERYICIYDVFENHICIKGFLLGGV